MEAGLADTAAMLAGMAAAALAGIAGAGAQEGGTEDQAAGFMGERVEAVGSKRRSGGALDAAGQTS